ncbi:hypothetical protein AVEN_28842-1 [Araneus ventricosus]|uniref:Uncharacterized protein n=1 Tax=Araneus ventricosus TaxID=182803 RepID=A0A4Y2W7X5_ARAVE|nr:hypothetical protein AVEN_28842-1 [Araneus ventricosus]
MVDVWPSKYDLTRTGPHTRWIFCGIGFRAWKASGSDADSLSLGHRRLLFDSRIQCDLSRSTRSKSINIHSLRVPSTPYTISSGRPWRHMESSSTFKRISSPNRDIENPSTFEIPYSVAKFVAKMVAMVRGPGLVAASHPILTPVKLSSQP